MRQSLRDGYPGSCGKWRTYDGVNPHTHQQGNRRIPKSPLALSVALHESREPTALLLAES
jgi:hypothetical protein